MSFKRRKPRKVVWVIFYNGPGSTNVTTATQAAWHTKKEALEAIKLLIEPGYYSAEKFERASK